jgi:hypothetical protein
MRLKRRAFFVRARRHDRSLRAFARFFVGASDGAATLFFVDVFVEPLAAVVAAGRARMVFGARAEDARGSDFVERDFEVRDAFDEGAFAGDRFVAAEFSVVLGFWPRLRSRGITESFEFFEIGEAHERAVQTVAMCDAETVAWQRWPNAWRPHFVVGA